MERERKTENDDVTGPEHDTTRSGSETPPASGPHSPSNPGSENDRDGETRDNRKGGYGAG